MDKDLARWNSFERNFTFVGCIEEGLLDVTSEGKGNGQFTSGATLKVVFDLQYMLNFTFRSIVADDFFPQPGTPLQNNTIAHYLVTGEADVGMGFLYFLRSRLPFGSPMVSLSIERFYAYFIQPAGISADRLSKPFQMELAITLSSTLVLIGLFSTLVLDAVPRDGGPRTFFRKAHEGYLWAVSTLSQQGYPLDFSKISTQICVSIGMTLSVYLYAYYSATLITYFIADSDVIQTFDDIFKHKFSMYAIPSVNSTLLHRVKDTQRITFAQVDYEESIKRTFTRGHVHLDTADLYRMTLKKLLISDKEMCTNTSKVLVRGGDIHGGFYSRKGFGFKDLFNSKLMKIKERGLVSRYYESYLREYVVECQRTRKQYDDNIGLEDLIWLFSGLFGCIAFTFIEVSVEIMIRKRVRLRMRVLS